MMIENEDSLNGRVKNKVKKRFSKILIVASLMFPLLGGELNVSAEEEKKEDSTEQTTSYPYKGYLEKFNYEKTGQKALYFEPGGSVPYPWANEQLGTATVGPAGCGTVALSKQAQLAGVTELKSGNEVNVGNLAHEENANSAKYLQEWVIKPKEAPSLFKDGDLTYVTVVDSALTGDQQGGYQTFADSNNTDANLKAIKKGLDEGYYPVLLLWQPGHFVAVYDVDVKAQVIKIHDTGNLALEVKSGGVTSGNDVTSDNRAYKLEGNFKAVGFYKFKTKIQDATGSTTSSPKSDSETTTSGGKADEFNPFSYKKYKRNNLGAQQEGGLLDTDVLVKLQGWTDRGAEMLKYVVFAVSAVLLGLVLGLFLYYVALPNLGFGWQMKF